MLPKFAFASLALSLFFISSPARADDCSEALIAESCSCRSSAVKSTEKQGEGANKATPSTSSKNAKLAKMRVGKDSKEIAAARR